MKVKSNNIVKTYQGKWVSGSYVKLDGSRRLFHGKLLNDKRSENVITYLDLTKNAIRRISLHNLQDLNINCGNSHFNLGGTS